MVDYGRQSTGEQHILGWRFWLLWVLASVIGTVSILVAARLAAGYLIGIARWTLEGAFLGTLTGTLQWVVLRKRIPDSGFWVLATILGWAAGTMGGWVMCCYIGDEITWAQVVGLDKSRFNPEYAAFLGAIVGIIVGMVAGALQWVVLRKKPSRAGWWIPASMLSWGAGTAVDAVAPTLGVGAGMITGGAMVWLLRRRGL